MRRTGWLQCCLMLSLIFGAAQAGEGRDDGAEGAVLKPTSGPIVRCERLQTPSGPVVAINGIPTYFACHYLRTYWDNWEQGVADSVRQFAARGIHRFEVGVASGWADGGFDPSQGGYGYPMPRIFEVIRDADPHAQLILRPNLTPPENWRKSHPNELERDAKDATYEVSWASDEGFAAMESALRSFVRYVETSPFAGHVAGYNLSIQFEGVPYASGTEGAFTDYSPAMQTAFSRFVREKYGSVEALRAAWGESFLEFETVRLPSPDEHLGSERRFLFHHPVTGRKVRDYYSLMDELLVRRHTRLARAAKAACGGNKLVGTMGGYVQDAGEPRSIASRTGFPEVQLHKHHFSGPGAWGRIFEIPEYDFFFAPKDYHNTGSGGNFLVLNMPASQKLRGKLTFIEDDTRTHLHNLDLWNPGFASVAESVAAHRRNAAALYTEAQIANWMEQTTNWLIEPEILENLGRVNGFLQEAVTAPDITPDAICVLLDEDSEGWTKPTTLLDEELLYLQRNGGLSYCGVPVRFHLLSDLEKANFPRYKFYVLPNLYQTTPQKTKWLERIQRDGNVLLWLYGAGYVGEKELSVEGMRALTGIQLHATPHPWEHRIRITNWNHPITRHLPNDLVFGTTRAYAPIFHVDDAGATVLGHSFGFGMSRRPALALREYGSGARGRSDKKSPRGAGDYASIYCEAPNLPGILLREMARYAGCHVYLESNDFLIAGKDIVMVHAAKPGPRLLSLPGRFDVSEVFSGQSYGKNTSRVRFEFTRPATFVFRLRSR